MEEGDLMELFPQFVTAGAGELTAEAVTATLRDRERLREIAALRLTEDDVQHVLGDICREATRALQLPIGLVTIVLPEAQHFAAQHGVGGWLSEAGGTPVEWSFCQYTVTGRDAFLVEDAERHRQVRGSPLVSQDGLRCYAGIPLITSRGQAVGSLCVAGTESREFSDRDLETLKRFAAEAVRRLETRRVEVRP